MRRVVGLFVLVALATAGIVAGVFAPGGSAKVASVAKSSAVVQVSVKASEFKFVFSKRTVPAGTTVVFTVKNVGKITHDFKIAGKDTPKLAPGKSAKLTVKFKKKGHYPYLCTLLGHAGAGMKGTFSVGVAAVKPPPVTTTTPTTTVAPPPTSTIPVGNASTTVQVGMFDYRFDLSQSTIPSGQVTFVVTNKGAEVHNFDIVGVHSGALIGPGQTETFTVAMAPNAYNAVCDVPFHVDRGMVIQFTVTK